MNPELVYIEWEDACGPQGIWVDIEDMKPDQPINKSVGWLVAEDERWVIVVPHLASGPNNPEVAYTGQGEMTIPKSAILKKKILNIE